MTDNDTAAEAWEALHRAQISLLRNIRQQPAFKPVTFAEYDVLHILSTAGDEGMRLNRLNEHVPLTQSSLSRMIDRLEARRFVQKWQDPDDLRGLRLNLTPYGHELHANIEARHREHIAGVMTDALTPDELDTLTRLTTKLHTHTRP